MMHCRPLSLFLIGLLLCGVHAMELSCSLCPDGRPSPTPDLRVPTLSGVFTCAELEQQAMDILAGADCNHFAELSGYATLCRCHVDEDTMCTFCADGSDPSSSIVDGGVCEEEYLYLPYLEKGTDECTRTQHFGYLECGCPIPPEIEHDSCTLCADGSEPTGDLTTLVDETTSCNQLIAIAAGTDADTTKCHAIQQMGQEPCGCPTGPELCGLCADGSMTPVPDRIIDSENTTCADLHEAVSPASPICKNIQAAGHFLCECPTPPEIQDPQGPCTLCAGGETFAGASTFNEQDTLELTTCAETAAAVYSQGGSSSTCQYHQAYAFLYCGCETMPPPPESPSCTLCPGGAEPLYPDNIVPGSKDLKCGAANSVVAHLFGDDTCSGLEELQEACGCPVPEPCTLCGDGTLATLDGSIVIATADGDFSCAEIDMVAQNFEFGSDLGAFYDRCKRFQDRYRDACCMMMDADNGEPLGAGRGASSSSRVGGMSTSIVVTLGALLGVMILSF